MTNTIPAIVRAAESRDVLAAALQYEQMGFSVLACKVDKSPALRSWKHLTTRRANRETISLWGTTGILQSVGIICGEISNLVVIDCDGIDAVAEFRRSFPALTDTYTVVSGSGKGAHFYLRVGDMPPTTRTVGQPFGNIELRSRGSYIIAPPSMHPSGRAYRIGLHTEIKWVAQVHTLRRWIESLIKTKHGGIMPPPANQPVFNASAYARAALRAQADRVRLAPEGARNNQLNRAAFSMGRFIREGQISREEVQAELERAAAALAATDGIESVRRTIQSGISAGITKYEV